MVVVVDVALAEVFVLLVVLEKMGTDRIGRACV
jgi:hypothetical protein